MTTPKDRPGGPSRGRPNDRATVGATGRPGGRHRAPRIAVGALALAVVLLAAVATPGATATPSAAAAPARPPAAGAPTPALPAGDPWVVSLGDSYISGEAGRWAGNTDESSSLIDALGPTAYFDNPTDTAELIPGCHRSKSAEVHIGGAYQSKNLACSGAETTTKTESNGNFKPGLDFYDDGTNQGQALMLEEFATTNRVEHIAVSIGGNNFEFASIVEACVEDYLESTFLEDFYCSQDPTVLGYVSPSSAAARKAEIVTALQNVRQAMRNAGYPDGSYSISVQNYPAPIPYGQDFRYPESGYTRFDTGGCGFWDVDADWALNEALRTVNSTVFAAATEADIENLVLLDVSALVDGHRLCETGVELLPDGVVGRWSDPGAVDVSEWINQVRTLSTVVGPYEMQESLHPDYWAQLALRGCLRLVVGSGTPTGGQCVQDGDGLDDAYSPAEPPVALVEPLTPLVPAAAPNSYRTARDAALSVAAPGVLADDTPGRDGEVLVATLVDGPSNGTVRLLSNGSFDYRPAAGYVGTDTFTYRASSAVATSEVVTVTVVVAPPPAPAVTATPRFTG